MPLKCMASDKLAKIYNDEIEIEIDNALSSRIKNRIFLACLAVLGLNS